MSFLKNIQNLSLDVVSGSCCMAFFVSLIFKIQIPTVVYIVLGISVWLLYALDHLLDATEIGDHLQTSRHSFYANHKRKIGIIWFLLAIMNTGLIFLGLEENMIFYGLLLAIPVSIHFLAVKFSWFNQFPFLQKEISVAFAFCAGVVLPTLSSKNEFWGINGFYVSSSIFLIALQNLLLFSIYDFENDLEQRQKSFAVKYGIQRTQLFVDILTAINIFSIFILSSKLEIQYISFFVIMQISMSFLRFFKPFFQLQERYRWVGDMVFSLPLFFVFI